MRGHRERRDLTSGTINTKKGRMDFRPCGPFGIVSYFAALAALMASISSGVTLNRSPQMP